MKKTTRKITTIQKEKLMELYFQLKFVKNLENMVLYNERNSYREFWDLWCLLSGKFSFNDLSIEEVKEIAYKSLLTMNKSVLNKNRPYRRRVEDIMERRKMGAGALDQINEVVINETVEDVKYDENNNELVRTKSQQITVKKIERIEFASEITINAIENIKVSQELAQEYFLDYRKALEAGSKGEKYEGKYQFHHLELAGKFKKIALDLADSLHEVIATGSVLEIKEAEMRLRAIMKYSEMLEQVKRIEMQPLYTLNVLHESGAARQNELQGAISNDRQMIEQGNIILKEEKLAIDRNKLRAELKKKEYSKIQDLICSEQKAVGAIEDQIEEIQEEIVNPKTFDNEIEDEFDRPE